MESGSICTNKAARAKSRRPAAPCVNWAADRSVIAGGEFAQLGQQCVAGLAAPQAISKRTVELLSDAAVAVYVYATRLSQRPMVLTCDAFPQLPLKLGKGTQFANFAAAELLQQQVFLRRRAKRRYEATANRALGVCAAEKFAGAAARFPGRE